MEKKSNNGVNGLANLYQFKYVESTYVDGNLISDTEKEWTADNLDDYEKFRDIWYQLEFDNQEHYRTTEIGSLMFDGCVSMVLEYTFETDQQQTIKLIRGISYKIAE